MFDPYCPTCAARVLLTARRLLRLEPTATGQRVRLRCWCGTEVDMVIDRIGAPAPRAPSGVGAASPVPGAAPTAA